MVDLTPPPGFDPEVVAPPPLPDEPGRLASLALDVSGTCNLACRYCAEAATQPRRRRMTRETVDAAWDLLFPDGEVPRGTSLRFGSGEPLLGLAALRRVAELISAHEGQAHDRPAVFLTTNGTLITREVMEWLVASGWYVKVSLDGPASIHDAWRVRASGKGTYARVAAAVAELAQRIPERFSVTAVLCHGSEPQVVFGALAEMGVKRIELVPAAHRSDSVQPQSEDIERYAAFVQNYARQYLEGENSATLVRLADRVTRVMGYENVRVGCGAGRSFLGVGPDGGLYPCFRFIGVESFRLGSVSSGLDGEAAAAFRRGAGRGYEERAPCRDCWAAPLCGGPCFACAEMFGPGEGAPIPSHCAYVLADARAAVWLVERLRERDPLRLLSFLHFTLTVE